MKRFLFFYFLFIAISGFSQTGFQQEDESIYKFLKRMEGLGIIQIPNEFHLPFPTFVITDALRRCLNSDKLSLSDRNELYDYLKDYEPFLEDTVKNINSLLSAGDFDVFNERNNFIYFSDLENGDFIGVEVQLSSTTITSNRTLAQLSNLKGTFSGKLNKYISFRLQGANGIRNGSKDLLHTIPKLEQNFGFTKVDGDNFFDGSNGYFTYESDNLAFRIGREKIQIGYGGIRTIVSGYSQDPDYFSISFTKGIFSFNSVHAKLLGEKSLLPDTITGGVNVIKDKHFAYHRVQFSLPYDIYFGMGELTIYSRALDLSYINPFTFYKSVEHSNYDRDNSMLFIDIKSSTFHKINLYGTLLLDDISYGKLGTGWWGNQTILQLSADYYEPINHFPLDIHLDYLKIEPYVFSHRLSENNYSNFGYPIGIPIQPNSWLLGFGAEYRFTHRVIANLNYYYSVHGANELDDSNNILVNHGGDFRAGHRVGDAENIRFLEGVKEFLRDLRISVLYKPAKNISMNLFFRHGNRSFINKTQVTSTDFIFDLTLKL